MGKDGKKGAESGKKSGRRKKKSGGLPQVSWKEAVLAYQ